MLILSGDQLYRMDFRQLIETHRGHRADVTIAVIPVPEKDTAGFGIVSMDDARPRDRVRREAARRPRSGTPYFTPAEWIEKRGIPCSGRHYLANMGIYLFKHRGAARPAERQAAGDRLRQGGLPAELQDEARLRPPVRRLLGRPRHDQELPRGEPGPGRARTRRSTSTAPRA